MSSQPSPCRKVARHDNLAPDAQPLRPAIEATGNTVNLLCWLYLRSYDNQDRVHVLDKLSWVCRKACPRLYLPDRRTPTALPVFNPERKPATPEARLMAAVLDAGLKIDSTADNDRDSRTTAFFRLALMDLLAKYRHLPPDEVDRLALACEFRWIVRQVRNRLISKIRHEYAEQRREARAVRDETEVTKDYQAQSILPALDANRSRLNKLIGPRAFETLRTMASAAPLGKTKRAIKGAATRAIAARRKITPQQARTDRRNLLWAISECGDYLARHFAETILGSDLVESYA